MQTSIFLPLILIAGTGADTAQTATAQVQNNASLQDVFNGCRAPVLDPTEASRILYDAQMETGNASDKTEPTQNPLFIARCGDEFVLFERNKVSAEDTQEVLYLRFQDGTYELVDKRWG